MGRFNSRRTFFIVLLFINRYCSLKNYKRNEIKEITTKLLNQVHLPEKVKSMLVNTLSGGMKRKLCVALSLIGNPSILYLDEPTTGMDPISRHHVWELLHQIKNKTLLILTTHSMEVLNNIINRKLMN